MLGPSLGLALRAGWRRPKSFRTILSPAATKLMSAEIASCDFGQSN
jgi:hypothetical protein